MFCVVQNRHQFTLSSRIAAAFVGTSIALLFVTASANANVPTSTTAAVPTITIAVPITDTPFSHPYIALARGFFQQAGVDVKTLDAVGGNVLTLLTSGQADLAMFGAGNALLPVAQGKETSIIYNPGGGGLTACVAVNAGSQFKTLADLSGKNIGTIGLNGSAYGMVQLLSDSVKAKGGSPFTTRIYPNPTSLVGALRAGQIDAAVGPEGWFDSSLLEGSLRLVLDPKQLSTRVGTLGGYFIESSIFGMTDNLKQKRDAVQRFLVGIAKANDWIHRNNPAALVAALQSTPAFSRVDKDSLLLSSRFIYNFWTPYEGFITQRVWTDSQPLMTRSNLGIDLTKPEFAYARRIDTSYLAAALKASGLNLKHGRTISLSVARGTARGRISAKDPYNYSCLDRVTVQLQSRTAKGWRNVARATTTKLGTYAKTLRSKGTYRAVIATNIAGGAHVCLAAKSAPVRAKG